MTVRLSQLAVTHYDTLDGYAVAHNMPEMEEIPLRRLCNFVYWHFTKNASEQADIDKFRAKLWQPPKGQAADERSPWSPENEQKALKAIKAQFSSTV